MPKEVNELLNQHGKFAQVCEQLQLVITVVMAGCTNIKNLLCPLCSISGFSFTSFSQRTLIGLFGSVGCSHNIKGHIITKGAIT